MTDPQSLWSLLVVMLALALGWDISFWLGAVPSCSEAW